jgi:hypothetical protein
MALPLKLPIDQMQTKWKSQIDPVLGNQLLQGQLLSGVVLNSGTPTVVNHGLGRKLVGWFVVGIDAAATIYDSQASNQTPQTTLILNSNAVCTVNLWVF